MPFEHHAPLLGKPRRRGGGGASEGQQACCSCGVSQADFQGREFGFKVADPRVAPRQRRDNVDGVNFLRYMLWTIDVLSLDLEQHGLLAPRLIPVLSFSARLPVEIYCRLPA
jgi:hypothetical protein